MKALKKKQRTCENCGKAIKCVPPQPRGSDKCMFFVERLQHLEARADKEIAGLRGGVAKTEKERNAAQAELSELREAADVSADYSHENMVVLVRNAVPQVGHALELMLHVKTLQEELANVRRLLECERRPEKTDGIST